LARGKTAEEAIRELGYTVQLLDNGKRQVPSIFLTPTFVTKANMVKTVVSDDWHPLEKVYKNIPKDQWPK